MSSIIKIKSIINSSVNVQNYDFISFNLKTLTNYNILKNRNLHFTNHYLFGILLSLKLEKHPINRTQTLT